MLMNFNILREIRQWVSDIMFIIVMLLFINLYIESFIKDNSPLKLQELSCFFGGERVYRNNEKFKLVYIVKDKMTHKEYFDFEISGRSLYFIVQCNNSLDSRVINQDKYINNFTQIKYMGERDIWREEY